MAPKKRHSPDAEIDSNTRISASKYWCFTLNNYSNYDLNEIIDICTQISAEYSIGKEIGKLKGTPHLQGFIKFATKTRPFESFHNKRIIWEKSKSNLFNNLFYTQKEDNFFTNIKQSVKILKPSEFYPWQQDLIATINSEPDDRTIHWYWEEKGCAGKTAIAKYICARKNAIIVSGKSDNCKNAILQYFNSRKQYPDIIIVNIPRCNSNHLSYEAIESIKDGLFYSGKYEGGMVIMNPPHVVIFSNEEPEYERLTSDRWHVVQI